MRFPGVVDRCERSTVPGRSVASVVTTTTLADLRSGAMARLPTRIIELLGIDGRVTDFHETSVRLGRCALGA